MVVLQAGRLSLFNAGTALQPPHSTLCLTVLPKKTPCPGYKSIKGESGEDHTLRKSSFKRSRLSEEPAYSYILSETST